jgi:hypothetical protein
MPRRLPAPPVFRVFGRQADCFAFFDQQLVSMSYADALPEDRLKTFTFETPSGVRKFLCARVVCMTSPPFPFAVRVLVTTLSHNAVVQADFWREMCARQPCDRHFYELIREFTPARLFFDVEFSRASNPAHDGDAAVDLLIRCVAEHLQVCRSLLSRRRVVCRGRLIVPVVVASSDRACRGRVV